MEFSLRFKDKHHLKPDMLSLPKTSSEIAVSTALPSECRHQGRIRCLNVTRSRLHSPIGQAP
jgi:hypothetical protein